jgi:hypothetical protein
MKDFIAFIGVLFLVFLWILPAYCLYYLNGSEYWAIVYVPIILQTILFGFLLDKWYD